MKTFYRIANLILTNLLSTIFGFVIGMFFVIAVQEDKKEKENKRTEVRYDRAVRHHRSERKRVVGFSYDETEG